MLNLESTGLKRYARLANTSKQKCLFAKLSLAVVRGCDVAKNSHIFLTRANQLIQKINRHFGGNLNHFGPMVFA